MSERMLNCLLYPGMFSDEVAVEYAPKRPRTSVASFFVPKDRVVGDVSSGQARGRMLVKVFREGNTTWAVVPNETQSVIEVDEADLVAP